MKKIVLLILAAFIMTLSPAVVDAKDHRDSRPHYRYQKADKKQHPRWSHPSYRDKRWHKTEHVSLSFKWHERRDRISYRMQRVHDRDWNDRFPGLHSYRWRDHTGKGFWYRDHYVRDAVFFFDDYDELVSIGFMHKGAFIFVRDDDDGYRNDDSFFVAWWDRYRD